MDTSYQANAAAAESAARMNEETFIIDYDHPYGKPHFHCLDITVGEFRMVMDYFTPAEGKRNQVVTYLYHIRDGERTRQFMIQKKDVSELFPNLMNSFGESHRMDVTYENWGYRMLEVAESVKKNREAFLRMCRKSCPFNSDGTNRHKDWKTTANLEIVSQSNCGLIQGIKGGATPTGRYTGGNGSFIIFDKCQYQLKCTLKCLSYDKPVRNFEIFIDADEYIRGIREKLGRTKLPYDMLNSCLPSNVEVITTDMEREAEDRQFVPIGYGHNWLNLLNEAFSDIIRKCKVLQT